MSRVNNNIDMNVKQKRKMHCHNDVGKVIEDGRPMKKMLVYREGTG